MAQYSKFKKDFLDDSRTLFEVSMLADQYGNMISGANPSGMAVDAFGRARISQPLTIFDSTQRYVDNELFATANTSGGTFTHEPASSSFNLEVDTTSGASVARETFRVFAYQPGKSLQILNTFVMAAPKANLVQRVGYFGANDGVFVEQNGTTTNFVLRSSSSGSLVETRIPQSEWNVDKLDGTGVSRITLDMTKAQIFFTDIEWLGVGSVRVGFVIDGIFQHCHTFHHANFVNNVYMTTASLPIRYEIFNTDETTGSSILKQICSTVISEGGYELSGRPRSLDTGIVTGDLINMPTAGTFVPVISFRLKSDRLDSIAVLRDIKIIGVANSTRISYKLVKNPTLGGNTTFESAGSSSSLEFNKTANTVSGGITLITGLSAVTNQSVAADTIDSDLFKYQFERNGLTNTPTIISLVATGANNNDKLCAAANWEEIV